jgi:pimeloyl-ACP methyl ester carboxylesterase
LTSLHPLLYLLTFLATIAVIFTVWAIAINWQEWRARLTTTRERTGAGNYSPAKFIEIDGFKIHYVQEGRGPDLLLVHGLGGSLVCWAPIFSDLKKKYRVTALDLPGFGRSDKRLDRAYTLDTQTARLKQFIEATKIERPFVVGHSMGGAITTWLARTSPTAVNKLLLLAPALNHRIVALHPGLFTWFLKPTGRLLVNKAMVRWMYTKRTLRKLPPNVDELVEEYYKPYTEPGAVDVFLQHAHLLRDKRLPGDLAKLSTPTLILVGKHDLVFPPRYLNRFAKMNPQIEIIVTPESGHQIMEEEPAILLRHINNFLT